MNNLEEDYDDADDGYEVAIHQSLLGPILVAGLPRTLAYLLWSVTIAMAFGARQLWFLAIGIVVHVFCVVLTRADPYIFDVVIEALKDQDHLEP